MKRLTCKLLGHAWEPGAAEFYCVYDCMRCGITGYESSFRERLKLSIYWRVEEIRQRWYQFRQWLKCSECGERFGKHDDSFDHIPF